ncbi:MAG: hypothetical protein JOY64_24020 [Alphaproteobacteria bacterium]|nr:hypothetical protein [Alphaproteobacteria bacterium]
MLSTIIVGGGPGGLGPLVWAAQQGLLPDWLKRGIAVIERQDHLGGTLGRFGIQSDSLGGSYLECLQAAGLPQALQAIREDPVAAEMACYADSFPPLQLVDRFMRRLGTAMAEILGEHSALHLGTEARSVRLRDDGAVVVETVRDGGPARRLVAHSAVIALGGRPFWPADDLAFGLSLGDCRVQYMMPSDRALSRAGLEEANRLLGRAGGRPVVILGGSHSAYSVAGALLDLPAAAGLSPRQILILQRREPRIFYPDRAAALADRYDVEPGDICPRTQRVNRMGGLRGYGREMWRQITGRPRTTPEPRVAALPIGGLSRDELRQLIEAAAVVIPCFGYRSATLPVFDANGRRLAFSADQDGIAVGQDSRLLLADGTALGNLFGIGLGSGYRLPASMGGEPNFDGQANSLWLYQNDIGAVIYRAIHDLLAAPAAAA